MIRLTKLNRSLLALNAELIKTVENAPDTVITLTTGDKVIVRETMAEVIEKVCAYRRSIASQLAADSPTMGLALVAQEPFEGGHHG